MGRQRIRREVAPPRRGARGFRDRSHRETLRDAFLAGRRRNCPHEAVRDQNLRGTIRPQVFRAILAEPLRVNGKISQEPLSLARWRPALWFCHDRYRRTTYSLTIAHRLRPKN